MRLLDRFETQEREVGKRVRQAVLDKIQHEQMSDEQFAEKLGFMPSSARLLRERETWPLDVAVRVAAALGLEVRVDVRDPGHG
jgi:hypothetical protein